MTTFDYYEIMKGIRIAQLKAHFSRYLRSVRRGQTVTVLDRETPVARLVPYHESSSLRIRLPAPGTPAPKSIPLPPPLGLELDVHRLLMEERQPHR